MAEVAARITKDTLLPVSLVLLIVGGIVWLNNRLLAIEYRLDAIDYKVNIGIGDRWRGEDMIHWAELLQAQNPDLIVPKPIPKHE